MHLIVDVNCPSQVTEWVRSKTVIKMKRKRMKKTGRKRKEREEGDEEDGRFGTEE